MNKCLTFYNSNKKRLNQSILWNFARQQGLWGAKTVSVTVIGAWTVVNKNLDKLFTLYGMTWQEWEFERKVVKLISNFYTSRYARLSGVIHIKIPTP